MQVYVILVDMSHILRYIFHDTAERILDVFTNLFDIRIAFFTIEGTELKVGKDRPLCHYCNLLREQLGYEDTCLALDRKMRERAVAEKKLIDYTCHGGMTEAIKPVFIDEELTGFLMIGQYRSSNNPIKRTLARAWKKQESTNELEQAFQETPYYPKDYVANILQLFDVLVDHILYRRMVELYGSNSLQPLVSFLKTHVDENLSLSDATKILPTSQSSLAHKFKKVTGKSFKRFQIDLKLNKAEEILRKHPEITVKEVAFRLGYTNPFYFSRLYKKHRKKSPSDYRRQFRTD